MRLLKFLNIYEVSIVQEARSSPKSAPNMVHDHAFRTITTLMAHPVRHLRPRLELCDFCPGNHHPYNVPIILNKTVHLTQYNTISYNGNFCRLLSL